jgi:CheY-like chemotaxis protein
MNGIAATKEIRKLERENGLPETPIIMMSGDSNKKSILRAKRAGINEFIPKPASRYTLARSFFTSMPSPHTVLLIDNDQFCL